MAKKDISYERVKYIVAVLTRCTPEQASKTATEYCKDPKAMAALASACGITSDLAAASAGVSVGLLAFAQPAASLAAAAFSAANYKAAKEVCQAMVRHGATPVVEPTPEFLQSAIP